MNNVRRDVVNMHKELNKWSDKEKQKFVSDYNNLGWIKAREKYNLERGDDYLIYRQCNIDLGIVRYKMRRWTKWNNEMKNEFIEDSKVLTIDFLAEKYNIAVSTASSYIIKFKEDLVIGDINDTIKRGKRMK